MLNKGKRSFVIKCKDKILKVTLGVLLCFFVSVLATAQNTREGKKISSDLFGLFFEDINYSADGGLYAELVQNRSFEYSPTDRPGWNPFSFWEYITPGFSYGAISMETKTPVHPNNPHYVVLNVEHVGDSGGVGIKNYGFDGMVIRAGEKYNLNLFVSQITPEPVSISVSLQNRKGNLLAESSFSTSAREWKKYTASLIPNESNDSATLVIMATTRGKLALDVISLFPEKTFRKRSNGMRVDLAQLLADMKPKFIRFPGGCLAHGDGLGNMYRWKNTIGPIEERVEQKNIWNYHQTMGLGYFEYFQFCEDIRAKPVPVLPAGVSCQNSGGTWRIGGTGQKAIPMSEMPDYIQEVLDLIEWANGPATSTWGAKRAAAGHAAPFNLQYIGIGNEDKITPEFEERFKMIYNAVKTKHPEITVIGTVGPGQDGDDFIKGWKFANQLSLPVVDEHYYCAPRWFMSNLHRYDSYKRNATQVYLGEYASWGNKMSNAITEAVYLISLERNGDVVKMASYAPLLAKKGFTQWKTDMIYFDNVKICPSVNYYVQKMFSANQGDLYLDKIISLEEKDSTLAASCIRESKTGDIILKLANAGKEPKTIKVNLSRYKNIVPDGEITVLTGNADAENTFENSANVVPQVSTYKVSPKFEYSVPSMSLTVLRIKIKNN
jgi:alpha-N-arabinofuranosidase